MNRPLKGVGEVKTMCLYCNIWTKMELFMILFKPGSVDNMNVLNSEKLINLG